MAKRDVTGNTVQETLKVISRLREEMSTTIPYGPLRKFLTAKETRLELQRVDPQTKSDFIQRVGDEEWRRMMDDLYGDKR